MPTRSASAKRAATKQAAARARTKGSAGIVTRAAQLEPIALPTTADAASFEAMKFDALATLAGGIAHDFNNILTGIVGYQELAAEFLPADEPAREYLGEARHAALRARTLVEQILTFGKRRTAEQRGAVSLAGLLNDTAATLSPRAPAGVALEVACAPGCDVIHGDALQLKQLAANLADNALDALRARGGKLRLALAPADPTPALAALLDQVGPGTHVRLTVSDTGHGIDAATLPRIFDPFFTTKPAGAATGLGLAVAHAIVRAHDGAITVESKPGCGTTFDIFLPIAAADRVPARPAARAGATGDHICLVEDDPAVSRCLCRLLERDGRQVRVFASADECLAAVGPAVAGISAALIDQSMPGAPGIELAAKLRRLRRDLPVVVMSAFFTKVSPDALGELGGFELLAKPFTSAELDRALHRARLVR